MDDGQVDCQVRKGMVGYGRGAVDRYRVRKEGNGRLFEKMIF